MDDFVTLEGGLYAVLLEGGDLTVEFTCAYVCVCVYVTYVCIYVWVPVRPNTVYVKFIERKTVYTNKKHYYEWVWTGVDNG